MREYGKIHVFDATASLVMTSFVTQRFVIGVSLYKPSWLYMNKWTMASCFTKRREGATMASINNNKENVATAMVVDLTGGQDNTKSSPGKKRRLENDDEQQEEETKKTMLARRQRAQANNDATQKKNKQRNSSPLKQHFKNWKRNGKVVESKKSRQSMPNTKKK